MCKRKCNYRHSHGHCNDDATITNHQNYQNTTATATATTTTTTLMHARTHNYNQLQIQSKSTYRGSSLPHMSSSTDPLVIPAFLPKEISLLMLTSYRPGSFTPCHGGAGCTGDLHPNIHVQPLAET